MGLRWVPRKTRDPQDRSAAASGPGIETEATRDASPYSEQYETMIAQGHERPTPVFGAPDARVACRHLAAPFVTASAASRAVRSARHGR